MLAPLAAPAHARAVPAYAHAGAAPSSQCAQAPGYGSRQIALVSGGVTRTALVHLPPIGPGRPLALLIALHGAGQDGAFFERYTGFSAIADGEGYIVAYPNATTDGTHAFWTINDSRPGAADDVRFISDLITQLENTQCVDTQRVYATGVSNGAGMAARLGCELSARIAAIAPIAGGYRSLPPCRPLAPVSVLEVHGTADGAVPYGGAPSDGGGAVRDYLGAWAARDGCHGVVRMRRVAPRVLGFGWGRCAAGTNVAHLEVLGGGHQLPGALPPDRGQASTVSAAWEVWRFLRDHARPSVHTGSARPLVRTGSLA